MKQMHQPPDRPQFGPGGRHRRPRNRILNTGIIHVSPLLAFILGGAGIICGIVSNFTQGWTSFNAFDIMLMGNGLYLGILKRDPVHATGMIPTFNFASLILAAFFQVGVLLFTLRIDDEFKRQLSQAKSQGAPGRRRGRAYGGAVRQTAVQIAHNRDFLFYYGIMCFVVNCLGDYEFISSFTDDVFFLFFWAAALTATSTLILAVGFEKFWAGWETYQAAKEQWKEKGTTSQSTGGGA